MFKWVSLKCHTKMFISQLWEMVILLSFEDLSLEDAQRHDFIMSHKDVNIPDLRDGIMTTGSPLLFICICSVNI